MRDIRLYSTKRMHFFLPPWLRHGTPRSPTSIFSVDIQPDGPRLATAGQDGAVKLWSLPHLARLATATPSTTTSSESPPPGLLLATISSHSSAVNCVRWNPAGSLLASAGDDGVVLIYERQPASGPVFGVHGEGWRVRKPLRAHRGDVTDICWSPDGERIASASVDNAIYIWCVRTERAITRLDGHKGLVKGIAWDPVGRYLASQSDDRTLRIWRTADWKTDKVISKPFDEAVYRENSMAFFLRLSWSPCGTQLLATNAYKKPGAHHAPMFSRASAFEEQIEFVGHREPVVSTRFSPRLYRQHSRNASPKDAPTYTCLALGSKDCGATIWQAGGVRPFFDMAHMFDMDVIDLTWGSDGYTLVCCSTDGKVMYLSFTCEELGDVVSQSETRKILTDVWREFGSVGNDAKPIPESALQLGLEQKNYQTNVSVIMPTSTSAPAPIPTPSPAPAPAPLVRQTGMQAMTDEPGNASVETNATPAADPRVMAAQAETRVPGGKRRITPMAVNAISPLSTSPLEQASRREASQAEIAPPKCTSATRALGASKRANGVDVSSVLGQSVALLPASIGEGARCRVISDETPPTILEARGATGVGGGGMVIVSKGGVVQWRDFHAEGSAVTHVAGVGGKFVAVCTADGFLFLYSARSGRRLVPPVALDAGACLLEARIVEGGGGAEEWFVVVVSRSAMVCVFDVRRKKLACARSAVGLLVTVEEGKGNLRREIWDCNVTKTGEPLLLLSDGCAFVYSRSFAAWLRVVEEVGGNSDYVRGGDGRGGGGGGGLLRELQMNVRLKKRGVKMGMLSGMGDLRRAAVESLGHLESLMECAKMLGCATDYRYYVCTYAARCAQAIDDDVENCMARLREVCDELLNGEDKDLNILGLSCRHLLKHCVLPVLSANRKLQRFVAEYDECLKALE